LVTLRLFLDPISISFGLALINASDLSIRPIRPRPPPPSFFVFAKLRNHQIIFFPSTNAERGIFVRRRRSLASVRGQCDAIATSSSFVDLSFMQRDCFDTHFQPTSISRGVFFGTDTWRGWS
jgi:hypothetical protein